MITAACHFGNVSIAPPQKWRSDFTLAASSDCWGPLDKRLKVPRNKTRVLVSTLELQCPQRADTELSWQSVPGRAGLGLAGCGAYLLM